MIRTVTPQDAHAIADIYNVYILNSVATFETETLSPQEMCRRIESLSGHYPYFVYEEEGKVLGFCYAHKWKEREAYCHTLEVTIYVDVNAQRRGIGKALMNRLMEECRSRGVHVLVSCIVAGNENSIAMHERLGFRQVAHFHEVGRKFDRWLDVIDFQLLL